MKYALLFWAVRVQVSRPATHYLAALGHDGMPMLRAFLRASRAERKRAAYIWNRLGR